MEQFTEKIKDKTAENQDSSASISSSQSVSSIDYPDGGLRAWLVVCGSMCCTFSTFGFVNAWGVFQSYYETSLLQDSSPSNLAWIGSIQYALVFGPALFSGRLLDLGYFRGLFAAGTVLVVTATLLVAQCTEYWQFLLCQGIAIGLGCGLCFGPTLGIVGHWFLKRRGLALGLTAVGSSIGGTIYPISSRLLIPNVGFPWTMRIMAFINLAALGIANITLTPRLPPKDLPGGLLNIRVFESAAFTIWCILGFVCFLGIYTVLTFIDVTAVKSGVSPDFSFYLVSMANASSGIGRLMTGILADKVGAISVMVPMSLACAVMTYAWPYAQSKEALIAIAILYGFASSAFVSSFNIPVYAMGEMGDIGRRLGTVFIFTGVGALIGPPISGAINRATGGVQAVSYYAGTAVVVSVVLMLVVKRLILGRFWGNL
ncbi:major facilitator superfamily domain-containing protein [Panaeolus papilionaceus]|nr:major facilitator superfamily domain-containing protein [Panaeolus papilionaceus]